MQLTHLAEQSLSNKIRWEAGEVGSTARAKLRGKLVQGIEADDGL